MLVLEIQTVPEVKEFFVISLDCRSSKKVSSESTAARSTRPLISANHASRTLPNLQIPVIALQSTIKSGRLLHSPVRSVCAQTDIAVCRSPSSPCPSVLPLDLVLDIAGRTDPATLVRCAATCKDARRRVAGDDSGFRRRLRHGDRFVRGLLRGHLVRGKDGEIKRVAANDAWSSSSPAAGPEVDDKPFALHGRPLAASNGLILVRVTVQPHEELRVYSSATGRYETLPPRPQLFGEYALLVGDDGEVGGGAAGRPFKVLNARLVTPPANQQKPCSMEIHTFSSESGEWGPRTTIASPLRHPSTPMKLLGNPLVFRDAVHWLCATTTRLRYYHILTLHVGAGTLTSTELPPSFPHCHPGQILLATASPGGSPIVLVADVHKISAWSRSERTGKWRRRLQVVISHTAIGRRRRLDYELDGNVELRWFGGRSGVVLIRVPSRGELWWLDLRSKEVIRTAPGCSLDTEYYFPL